MAIKYPPSFADPDTHSKNNGFNPHGKPCALSWPGGCHSLPSKITSPRGLRPELLLLTPADLIYLQVQDMLNPEYYVGEYQRADGSWQTCRYSDELDEALPQGAETKLAERKPLLVIPVPGESTWVTAMLEEQAAGSLGSLPAGKAPTAMPGGASAKRPRSDGADEDSMSISVLETDATGQTDAGMAGADDADSLAPRFRGPGPAAAGEGVSADGPAAPAIAPPPPPGSCMVYVDGSDDGDVKLNDVVEVVGVLSRVPELAVAHLECLESHDTCLSDAEALAAHPPTSLAPRLHAILLKKEDSVYPPLALGHAVAAEMHAVRARTLGFLSMILGGDDVAAEYLLLQLVSRVHVRSKDSEGGALGTLPLNLTNCPSAEGTPAGAASPLGEAIAAALAALAPRCVTLPLSIDALNSAPWWPRRLQEDLRLTTGKLQLAPGTQLVADETVTAAGSLNEVGLRNLGVLQGIMQNQKVSYDFQFFTLDQPTDAPVTVLSTARTMLKGVGEVVVPLRPAAAPAAGAAAVHAAIAAGGNMVQARAYLAGVRGLEFSIPEGVAKVIEGEMAAARQADAENVNVDTLHRWMNVSCADSGVNMLQKNPQASCIVPICRSADEDAPILSSIRLKFVFVF